jgi:2-oxoglutarate ferredoxin oxidoreductase subunit delta
MKYWRKPLDFDQVKIPHGEVRIIEDRCKGCGFCVEYCPKDVLVMSDRYNRKGYHPPEVVKKGECVNCNLCEMICPDFAIFSVPMDGEEAEEVEAAAAAAQEATGQPTEPAESEPAKAEAVKEVSH